MWSAIYGVMQFVFWVAGRIEDTRSRKIRKSDLEIREELAREEAKKHEVHRSEGSALPRKD